MSKIRRISLLGAACSGKSTLAAQLFSELKLQGRKVELVTEYIKSMAYQGIKPVGFLGHYVHAKQIRQEEIFLKNGVDLIVSDSPLLLGCIYTLKAEKPFFESLLNATWAFEQEYPSINFLLNRVGIPYKKEGRYENHDEVIEVERFIKKFLDERGFPYREVPPNVNRVEFIMQILNKEVFN